MTAFLGLSGYRWLLLLAAAQTMLLLADALIGHYRSGFVLKAQHLPFVLGGVLALTAIAAAVAPEASVVRGAAISAGAVTIAGGLTGMAYHHWYGITTQPGGYRWLLHHLLHQAPPLAPLGLSVAGALVMLGALGASGTELLYGARIGSLVLAVLVGALTALSIQVGLLHYRGAYNNVAMYSPVIVLPVTAAATLWYALEPTNATQALASFLFVATSLSGFVGAGMHLRGIDRQMGGLYMGVASILDAPPPAAPLLVSALGACGVVAVQLL